MNIGINITRILKEKDMTTVELLKITGLHKSIVYSILNGDTQDPRISTLAKIAAALDVTVNDLIEGMEVPK